MDRNDEIPRVQVRTDVHQNTNSIVSCSTPHFPSCPPVRRSKWCGDQPEHSSLLVKCGALCTDRNKPKDADGRTSHPAAAPATDVHSSMMYLAVWSAQPRRRPKQLGPGRGPARARLYIRIDSGDSYPWRRHWPASSGKVINLHSTCALFRRSQVRVRSHSEFSCRTISL